MAASSYYPEGTPRELELLLLVTLSTAGDRGERIEEILAGKIDSDRLFELAGYHRLGPLLYTRLSEGYPDALPVPFMERLRAKAEGLYRNNLLLTAELIRLLGLFSKNGIPALPLKGPPLAQKLYGNLALRPFADLDILVPPAYAARGSELLLTAGYKPKRALSSSQEIAYLYFQHDRTFENHATGGYLELHWHFFSRYVAFPLDRNRFWEELDRGAVGGIETLQLPPEEELIFLAAHGSKHHWAALGWVLDIARLIEVHAGLDWERVWSLARETGSERMVMLALRVAVEFTQVKLPANVLERVMADRAVERLARQVRDVIVGMRGDEIGERTEHRFYLDSRERLRDRLHYYWFWTFTPNVRDRELADLPSGLYPLYYLFRPVRMMGDLIRKVTK